MVKNTRLILGLTGLRGNDVTGYTQSRAGKDTVAQFLRQEAGFETIALADGVKQALYCLNPHVLYQGNTLRLQELIDDQGWDVAKNDPEIRALVQRMGTDAGRDIHGEHLWLALAAKTIMSSDPSLNYVVTDIRFPNEAQWIKKMGGYVIRIERPDESAIMGINALHPSESHWKDITYDALVMNDGSLEDLKHNTVAVLKDIVQKHRL